MKPRRRPIPGYVAALIARGRRRRSPRGALAEMPSGIADRIDGPIEPLPASPPPKKHLMYAAGERLILHRYGNPSAQLRRALAERETIRIRAALEGIPALHAVVEESGAVWVLEDRLRGRHPSPHKARAWFPTVADWAVRLAGPPGPPLGDSAAWRDFRVALERTLPAHRDLLRRCLRAVEERPSRHLHGDFQRRNLLLGAPGSVGLVDWEGAWLRGLPGLDLVFLALLAESDLPEPRLLTGLLEGREPHFGRLLEYLARVGVTGEALAPTLLVMAASWTLGEERRLQRSHTPSAPRPWRQLLLDLAEQAPHGATSGQSRR